ncbi:hypothetical protein GCM10010116_01120 [Microbispora rosea subsp. aerata]|nr:phosphotransferase [Microbispora rosea]GGO00714.1 hypothetical protein GCM10010116_01120 [Microbispora rosea subsp. aerata]GIH56863.1 hypothetical protein Mro02_37770 [Microbispora rosea subsp. aerata]GLJ84348.1 hypothetical protein GCM10017588_30760 [Microbispora rosea subsp. aerata]
MTRVVEEFGTGFVHTTITEDGAGRYLWTRRPGPDRDGGVRRPHPLAARAVRAVSRGEVELVLPEPAADDAAVTYRTALPYSVAGVFLGAGDGGDRSAGDVEALAAATLTHAAGALARLHAAAPPSVELPGPEGPRRLLGWLRTGHAPRAGAHLHTRAVRVLGRDRMAVVEAWCAAAGRERRVLLHGAPGHGILVPRAGGRAGALLTGEDLAAGLPEFDVGWLIGELVEFREAARRLGHGPLREIDYDGLIGRVTEGYGAPLDPAAVSRSAVLRFLTHTHDFAAYVGWHDFLLGYLDILAGLVDAVRAGEPVSRGVAPYETLRAGAA